VSSGDDPLARTLDALARRGALDVFRALEAGAVSQRALVRRLSSLADSVVPQRLGELRRLGVIETVPENGDLRLSARGRRLQGLLSQLGAWSDDT
jgi:DNA-binding HxlR family transcriptional regulator